MFRRFEQNPIVPAKSNINPIKEALFMYKPIPIYLLQIKVIYFRLNGVSICMVITLFEDDFWILDLINKAQPTIFCLQKRAEPRYGNVLQLTTSVTNLKKDS
jgi:hypothetical protein